MMVMKDQEVYFAFLDSIRETGKINMFGSAPYLQEVYGLKRHEAKEIVLAWMESFSSRRGDA